MWNKCMAKREQCQVNYWQKPGWRSSYEWELSGLLTKPQNEAGLPVSLDKVASHVGNPTQKSRKELGLYTPVLKSQGQARLSTPSSYPNLWIKFLPLHLQGLRGKGLRETRAMLGEKSLPRESRGRSVLMNKYSSSLNNAGVRGADPMQWEIHT